MVALLLCRCGGEAHLAIEICGDLLLPDHIDSVRLVTRDESGGELTAGYRDLLDPEREADDPCPAVVHHLPIFFDLVEGGGEMLVMAEGLSEGVVRITSHAKAEFPVRGGVPVTLVLDARCLGVSCALGQTCRAGRCELVPRENAAICPDPAPERSEAERCPEEPETEEDAGA